MSKKVSLKNPISQEEKRTYIRLSENATVKIGPGTSKEIRKALERAAQ